MNHACPQCGTTTSSKGRCTKCARPENQRKAQRPTMTQVYNTPRWKELRRGILKRDHHTCSCGRPATTVDHIHPFTDANDPAAWNPGNLRALCHACHGHKDGARRQGTARRPASHAA